MGVEIASCGSRDVAVVNRPSVRPDETKSLWIYFLGCWTDEGDKKIKIGKTSDLDKRLRQLRNEGFDEPPNVVPLCAVKGKAADEGALKQHFRSSWIRKEYFRPSDELLDYIRWLRDQWFVAMPDMIEALPGEPKTPGIESLEEFPFDRWKPTKTRRKPKPAVLECYLDLFGMGARETTPDDFYTSPIILDCARKVMGTIDTDPASHAVANREVRATTFYTVSDDGLSQEWRGNVWLNPPFSAWSTWAQKLCAEVRSGRAKEACVLAATRTLTAQYFKPVLVDCRAVCILTGRIKFWGERAGDPDDGHAVFYFGQRPERFEEVFSDIGVVFKRG